MFFKNNKVTTSEQKNWHSVYSRMKDDQPRLRSEIEKLQQSINSVNLSQYSGKERTYMRQNIEALREQIRIAVGYLKQ